MKQICVICRQRFSEFGNNAWPVKDGNCCDACNKKVVLSSRVKLADERQGLVNIWKALNA